jgi:hypothetical protein
MSAELFNTEHPKFARSATLMDMANQREDNDQREAWLRTVMEHFRAAEERALVKRGITLWTHTERQLGIVPFADATLPPNKIN